MNLTPSLLLAHEPVLRPRGAETRHRLEIPDGGRLVEWRVHCAEAPEAIVAVQLTLLDARGHQWTCLPVGAQIDGGSPYPSFAYRPAIGEEVASFEVRTRPSGEIGAIVLNVAGALDGSTRHVSLGPATAGATSACTVQEHGGVFAGVYCTFGPHPRAGSALRALQILQRLPGPLSMAHLAQTEWVPAGDAAGRRGSAFRLAQQGLLLHISHRSGAVEVCSYAGRVPPADGLASAYRNVETGERVEVFPDLAGQAPKVVFPDGRGVFVARAGLEVADRS